VALGPTPSLEDLRAEFRSAIQADTDESFLAAVRRVGTLL
jgi:hypothetical protein